ncbi:asparagine synthase [Coprinopsis cinerea okayama7|uniref:Asparagine synthase n=1 Tax=Coprinopsis cinerea (strain Okayama-7 / 130 / ATCC MYA-4618 / FGSC 9003) TaxID=240176 RepID=A8N213_COPC7|nr:asparagine synthase [Coprinopsis cinerea okayama7\|eukprot:XP_001828912.2 asparagine synthase [Coprinopsis cinerea okayama7\
MCGIFVSIRREARGYQPDVLDAASFAALSEDLREANSYRGPDYQQTLSIEVPTRRIDKSDESEAESLSPPGHVRADFYGSELRLRGNCDVQQPHQRDGNMLCWNGEVTPEDNDGVNLMQELSILETPEEIRDLFGRIEGPKDKQDKLNKLTKAATHRLYFARDPLGRRSLLIHKPTRKLPVLLVSSVSSGTSPLLEFEEVTTEAIFCVDLTSLEDEWAWENFDDSIIKLSRQNDTESLPYVCTSSYWLHVVLTPDKAYPAKVNATLPPDDYPVYDSLDIIPVHLVDTVNELLEILDRSVALRVKDIPHNSEPNSARLAILFSGGIDSTILTFLAHRHIPIEEPIDLLNVAFENPRKIRIAQEGNLGGLPKRQKKKLEDWQAKQNAPVEGKASYNVPDRKTGLQELEELRRLCPGRKWNFLEINIPYEESQNAKDKILNLMLPSRTVMDLVEFQCRDSIHRLIVIQSLALALYFASRGVGDVRDTPSSSALPYTSPARVVLSGLGSDELLGGYGRHRTAYNAAGWQGVIDELQLEIDRIPQRNLGRDDRIISSHGKETRHPFLSLDVVSFLAGLPVHYKLDPRLEVGKGDKTLLRLLARKLGLVEASSRKKRAMQFGSHSARMDGERRGDADLADV